MDEQIGAEQQLSPWDRRVVRAMATAASARRAGPALRVLAAVLALVGLVGGLVYVSSDEFALGGTEPRVGVFLGLVLTPVGLAALVLGSSYLVQVAAA